MDTFGIAFNSTLQQYKASKKTPTEEEKTTPTPKPADSNDPFSKFENAVSGIFVSMGQKIKTVTETAGNAIASGARGLWEGTKNLFAGIGNGISNTLGRANNWLGGKGYNTDSEIQTKAAKLREMDTAGMLAFNSYSDTMSDIPTYDEMTMRSAMQASKEKDSLRSELGDNIDANGHVVERESFTDKIGNFFTGHTQEEIDKYNTLDQNMTIIGTNNSDEGLNIALQAYYEQAEKMEPLISATEKINQPPLDTKSVQILKSFAKNESENVGQFSNKKIAGDDLGDFALDTAEAGLSVVKEFTPEQQKNLKGVWNSSSSMEKAGLIFAGAVTELAAQIPLKTIDKIDTITVTDGNYVKAEIGEQKNETYVNVSINGGDNNLDVLYSNIGDKNKNMALQINANMKADLNKTTTLKTNQSLKIADENSEVNYYGDLKFANKMTNKNEKDVSVLQTEANGSIAINEQSIVNDKNNSVLNKLIVSTAITLKASYTYTFYDKTQYSIELYNNLYNVSTNINQQSSSLWSGKIGGSGEIKVPFKEWTGNLKANLDLNWQQNAKNKKYDKNVN